MNHVLVPVDAGPSTPTVLRAARSVAALYDVPALAFHAGDGDVPEIRALTDAAGIELQVTAGPPIETIAQAADSPAVLAVVLGACGASGGSRRIGHTALEVITRVSKPVVVVPPGAAPRERIARALTPLEGSEESSHAVAGFLELAHRGGVEIVVLHVHHPDEVPPFQDQAHHQARAWEREFAARFVMLPGDTLPVAQSIGAPSRAILTAMEDADPDLVVLAWSQTLAPGRARVVREALAHAPVPVLLVPCA